MTANNLDLANLDRLHAAAVKQEWTVEIEEYGNSGSVTITGLERLLHDTEWADPEDFEIDQAKAHWIANISNAYPALRTRIRELEAEVEDLQEQQEDRAAEVQKLCGVLARIASMECHSEGPVFPVTVGELREIARTALDSLAQKEEGK